MNARPLMQPDDALLIVDVQKDFCPGGALPVQECDSVISVLNMWIAAAQEAGAPIFASRDWHPYEHASFEDRGGRWPRHCVQGTEGAFFHEGLALPKEAEIISKGAIQNVDAYSAFSGTDLAERLEELGVRRLFVGGVAQEICVRETVLDALRAGFEVHVIREATSPVEEEAGREALAEMAEAGAVIEQGRPTHA